MVYMKTKIALIIGFVFYVGLVENSFGHKDVEPYVIEKWKRGKGNYDFVWDERNQARREHLSILFHDIFDKIDLTLAHYPIEVEGGGIVDHTERGITIPRVWVIGSDEDDTKVIVNYRYNLRTHFGVYFIISYKDKKLIDYYYVLE